MGFRYDLDQKDRQAVNKRFFKEGRISCYLCGEGLDGKKEIEYHLIAPAQEPFLNDIKNIAPICKKHKPDVKALSINEYLALKEMEDFFSKNRMPKLDDILSSKLGDGNHGKSIGFEFDEHKKEVRLQLGQKETILPAYACPSTGYYYFYVVVSPQYINNDNQLQPRPLEMKRLWELYRHLILYSQLTPSICRLVDSKIMLFDGQHKTAAQIWAGRDGIECKVYIDPRVKVLKETNLVAHDKLRQMPFFSSVLINKWADLFSEQWQEYINSKGLKSEAGFVSFLGKKGKKRAEALNMVASNIYDSILEDQDNRLLRYISEYNPKNSLITLGKLKQNIFNKFICRPPLNIDIEDSDRLREYERRNVLRLLNKLEEVASSSSEEEKINNIFLNGSLKAWSTLLKEAISQILGLYDGLERKKIFLRKIDDQHWDTIEDKTEKLFGHRIWTDNNERTTENLKKNRTEEVIDFLKNRGLSVNWIISDSGARVNVDNFID